MRRVTFDPLEVPNYGFQEAVRYLHVPNTTLHYWMKPSIALLTPADRQNRTFSFKNLVECYVLNGLREIHGVRVSRIRTALSYLRRNFSLKTSSRGLRAEDRWEIHFLLGQRNVSQSFARRSRRSCHSPGHILATHREGVADGTVDSVPFYATTGYENCERSSKGHRNESENLFRHASVERYANNYRDSGQPVPRRRLSSSTGEQLWATRRRDRGSDPLGNRENTSRLRISRFTSTRTSIARK